MPCLALDSLGTQGVLMSEKKMNELMVRQEEGDARETASTEEEQLEDRTFSHKSAGRPTVT